MIRRRNVASLALLFLLPGCLFNLHSLPFPQSIDVENSEAREFLAEDRAVGLELGQDLHATPYGDDRRIVGLAVSGGGMRASAFTLGVLAGLDDLDLDGASRPSAFDTLDFISSNSGGSWAVAAVLADRLENSDSKISHRALDIEGRFKALDTGKVKCWAQRFVSDVALNKTYADLYTKDPKPRLPRAYFNAALLPAQAPFVFTEDFLRAYDVRNFKSACDNESYRKSWPTSISEAGGKGRDAKYGYDVYGDLAGLPIGYAAATSGSVPGFTYSYAFSGLCYYRLKDATFCSGAGTDGSAHGPGLSRSFLHLIDGGVYDNIGYKTALELAFKLKQETELAPLPRTMIFVNSSTDAYLHTVDYAERDDSFIIPIMEASSFATQDATFARLRQQEFAAAGFDRQVVLDFPSVGGFRKDQEGLLKGLDALAYYALHNVACYDDARGFSKPDKRGPPRGMHFPPYEESAGLLAARGADCLSENFARTGFLYKTTYKYDEYQFRVGYELGELAVRMHENEILDGLRRQGPELR